VSVLDRLAGSTGVHWGRGQGPDDLVVRVVVTPGLPGTLLLDYEAWSPVRGLRHVEAVHLVGADVAEVPPGKSLVLREGEPGVFASSRPQRIGLVVTVGDDLGFSWWWPGDDGELSEQTWGRVHPVPTPSPAAAEAVAGPADVPWPGIVVLSGAGTGLVAGRLAARISRIAVVRADLFDRAVVGSTPGPADPALRQAATVATARAYAAAGLPVIVHGVATSSAGSQLLTALVRAGVSPVRLLEVAEGEDYGEVARRLIEG
jgi:hypothetical protein